MVIFCIGRFLINVLLFPYGNKLVLNYMEKGLNQKFAEDFSKILDRSQEIITQFMIEPIQPDK